MAREGARRSGVLEQIYVLPPQPALMSVTDVAKDVIQGNGNSAWARTAVVILAFGVMMWFDPRIGYMRTEIDQNRAAVAAMDTLGTRHSSESVLGLNDKVTQNTSRIDRIESRFEKLDATMTAILNRLPEKQRQ